MPDILLTVKEVKLLILLGRIGDIQVKRCRGKLINTFEWWDLTLLNITQTNSHLTGYIFRLKSDQ
jgi:hypothetical protein